MIDPFEDLEQKSLSELGEANDLLKRNVNDQVEAARAKGGAGQNKIDLDARERSRKQVKVESEIFSRLADIHSERSSRARALDESFDAQIADSPDQWADNPDRFDWPGLDTP